jgi:thiamine-phosphate pyrophosphorylase
MSSLFSNALSNARLYPLTDRLLSGLSHAEQVSSLSEGGATLIQLREKTLSSLDFFSEAAEALRVARERGVKIIINDRVDIALALKADGVHLGQEDLPPAAARELLGPETILGFSTHNLKQALLAVHLPIDYIAIGPIFSTATKQRTEPTVGLDHLREVRQALGKFHLVAIGGITSKNRQEVLDAGADAVAIISDIWTGSESEPARTQRLLSPPIRAES